MKLYHKWLLMSGTFFALVFQIQAQVTSAIIDTSKIFNIINVNSGKAMDVGNQLVVNGTKIIQNTNNVSQITQQWKFINLGNGFYTVINTSSGKVLNNGNTVSSGAQLQVDQIQTGAIFQQWRITDLGGKYGMINRSSTKAADVSGGSLDDNTPIVQWDDETINKPNQQWIFNVVVAPGTVNTQVSNLPSFYITTQNNAAIDSKDIYVNGHLTVVDRTTANGLYNGDITIKGRGNSTWQFDKKPYRIKLASKFNLLGMPAKEKSWVLLANYADKSLMRNALAFELSKALGFSFTPAYRFADVFINGEYQGNYMVTDQIEVAPNRVNIEKQDSTDIALPAITGGYLIEQDGYAGGDPVWFYTNHSIPISVKDPQDNINPQQKAYITNYVQLFEDALTGNNFKDSINGYRQYTDLQSAVNYYITSEFTGNGDAFFSTYLYKLRNNPKLYYGPVWDYDQAFFNNGDLGDVTYRHVEDYAYENKLWISQLLKDPYFKNSVKSRINTTITSIGNRLQFVADSLSVLLQQSQQLNFVRWPILNTIVYREPAAHGSFANEVLYVKKYITDHFTWLKDQYKDVDISQLYNIINVNSGKSMDLASASTSSGVRVVQKNASTKTSQQWKFVRLSNGYYQLINSFSGKALSNANLINNAVPLQVENVQPASNYQQWALYNIGTKYAIISRNSSKAVDIDGGSNKNNAPVIQWNEDAINKTSQQWIFTISAPGVTARNIFSADSLAEPNAIKFYPNPILRGQVVMAEVDFSKQSKLTVDLYSAQMELLKSYYMGSLQKGKQKIAISTAGLKPGIYLVNFITETSAPISQQLIIK